MPMGTEISGLHQRLVDTYAQLNRPGDLALTDKLDQLIQLKQTLRELCMSCRIWDAGMEATHDADVAALRSLISRSPAWPG